MKTALQQPVKPEQPTQELTELMAVIADHPFLKDLPKQHLQTLAASAMLKNFEAGEIIFREGDVANRFYLIRSGRLILESSEKDEEPFAVQEIGAGDVLGWSWLFPPYYWHFDARAVEPTKAIFFYGTRLREQSETDPALGYELMKRMSEIIIKRLQNCRRQLLETRRRR